jgi:hypothetical protein
MFWNLTIGGGGGVRNNREGRLEYVLYNVVASQRTEEPGWLDLRRFILQILLIVTSFPYSKESVIEDRGYLRSKYFFKICYFSAYLARSALSG